MRLQLVVAAAVLASGIVLSAQSFRVKQICPPCAPLAEAQQGASDLPAEALADMGWALGKSGVNVPPSAQGAPRRGSTSTILHIDTGVTRHPLLHEDDGTDGGGVAFSAADGLYNIGHKNIDPLLSGLLRFPGHGTKTASVIVGRETAVFTRVNGVATGARLVPVRATEGVVLFPKKIGELNADMRRVARAIYEAASGNNTFGSRIDVITMSLGGWPDTPDLCDSITAATKQGIIVLAASGNEIKRAKYPAKCPNAIAIAGSTIRQAPWSGSAGAPEVAVSAPAEAVWTASIYNGAFCLDASSGTSFAVALVAGIAAEWVADARRRGEFPTDADGLARLYQSFKTDLQQSARPWTGSNAESWKRQFGVGIVDMTELMRRARQ